MVHDGKDIIHKEYKHLCAEMYAEGHSFFTYISDSADSLASCCFSNDTAVCWADENGQVHIDSFESLYQMGLGEIRVPYMDRWVAAKCVKLSGRRMLDVYCRDHKYTMTDNHINLTADGEKPASELTVKDYLLYYENGQRNYYPVSKIEESDYKGDVYCFECTDQTQPYFTLPDGLTTHNCRLRNELTENTFNPTSGLTGVMTGSCNVITLNINRIIQDWWRSKEGNEPGWKAYKTEIAAYLTGILDRVYKYHIAFKTMLYDEEDKGMFAASNGGYIYVKKLFSTIGINGLNEAARFLGMEVSNNPEYIGFLQLILGTIKEQNRLHSIHDKKRPFLFNSEVVPAEGLGGKNYRWDKEDGYWVPEDENLYNSYFYNAHDNTPILDKFILHGKQTYQFTDGGSALHCNMDAHLSKAQYLKLIDFAIENGTNYFTFNVPNSKCEDCGHIVKAPIDACPVCGSRHITRYTRIIGYLRPVSAFGDDRQAEEGDRIYADGRSQIKTEGGEDA